MAKPKNEDQSVSFTVKELYQTTQTDIRSLGVETNRKLDTIHTLLEAKSDRTQTDRIEASLREMERHGCGAAQEALSQANSLSSRLTRVESAAVSAMAVQENTESLVKEQKNSKLQWLAIVGTFLLVLAEIIKPLFSK